MKFDPSPALGEQARTSVRRQRRSGKAGEIEDDGQEEEFAFERQCMPAAPMAVQTKDQPAGSDDRAQDKDGKNETAIRKKRIDELGEASVGNVSEENEPDGRKNSPDMAESRPAIARSLHSRHTESCYQSMMARNTRMNAPIA